MSTDTLPSIADDFSTPSYPMSIWMMPAIPMTQDQYFDFCQQNPGKRFERTAEGELIIMAPSCGASGYQDAEVCAQLRNWAKAVGKGRVTGSSGGYILPNGANRAPDAASISPEQLAALTPEQWKKFLPICPYSVIEVLSPSDSLTQTQAKLEEYVANGCQLG